MIKRFPENQIRIQLSTNVANVYKMTILLSYLYIDVHVYVCVFMAEISFCRFKMHQQLFHHPMSYMCGVEKNIIKNVYVWVLIFI